MVNSIQNNIDKVREVLATVLDPEVPVLNVLELGIIQDFTFDDNGQLAVAVMPTYSGCPAMDEIELNIRVALEDAGFMFAKVERILYPPWSSSMMTEEGKAKLMAYGISPPLEDEANKAALYGEARVVPCPQCQSKNTQLVSVFGSTACKSLFKCMDCGEPFDYFKCH
jgi:ring-1,2-phenylacetyl-CoA epoxidase subunit PaaD